MAFSPCLTRKLAETSNEHRRQHKKHVFCVCFVVVYVCYVVWKLQKHVFYGCFVVWRPKTRVLRVFCGLEAPGRSKGVPGRARAVQRCAQGAPLKEGWKHVEARMSLG